MFAWAKHTSLIKQSYSEKESNFFTEDQAAKTNTLAYSQKCFNDEEYFY